MGSGVVKAVLIVAFWKDNVFQNTLTTFVPVNADSESGRAGSSTFDWSFGEGGGIWVTIIALLPFPSPQKVLLKWDC